MFQLLEFFRHTCQFLNAPRHDVDGNFHKRRRLSQPTKIRYNVCNIVPILVSTVTAALPPSGSGQTELHCARSTQRECAVTECTTAMQKRKWAPRTRKSLRNADEKQTQRGNSTLLDTFNGSGSIRCPLMESNTSIITQ